MDHPAIETPSESRNASAEPDGADALFLRSYDLDRSHRLRVRIRDDDGRVTAETSHRLPPGGFDVLPDALDGRAASVEVTLDGAGVERAVGLTGAERLVESTGSGAERLVEPTDTDAERTDDGATVIECGSDGVHVTEWTCR